MDCQMGVGSLSFVARLLEKHALPYAFSSAPDGCRPSVLWGDRLASASSFQGQVVAQYKSILSCWKDDLGAHGVALDLVDLRRDLHDRVFLEPATLDRDLDIVLRKKLGQGLTVLLEDGAPNRAFQLERGTMD